MIAEISALLVVGSRLFLTFKERAVSVRTFVAMKDDIKARGFYLDPTAESKLRWRWSFRPTSVIAESDSEDLRSIKAAPACSSPEHLTHAILRHRPLGRARRGKKHARR